MFDPVYLTEIERDRNGTDIALARVEHDSSLGLRLSREEYGAIFQDVTTWGYPLSSIDAETGMITANGRGLKGYIMRALWYQHPRFGRTDSFELDMAAPQGLSGSPVLLPESNEVIGVVYGQHDVATIEHFGSVDPDTGEREPEVNRVVSFGLAHHVNALRAATATATGGHPLEQVLP